MTLQDELHDRRIDLLACPSCKSQNTYMSGITDFMICRDCKQEWYSQELLDLNKKIAGMDITE